MTHTSKPLASPRRRAPATCGTGPSRALAGALTLAALLWVPTTLWAGPPRTGAVAQVSNASATGLAKAISALPVAEAQAQHPTIREVSTAGYLTILNRERALSDNVPAYLAWAIADAPGATGAATYAVAPSLTRALRARHSIGPSGSALNQQLKVEILSAREAFVLGWLRALGAASRADLERRSPLLNLAGSLQLLEQAVKLGPNEQAHHLALAALKAVLAPTKGSKACDAWRAVQEEARSARQASVGLTIAEGVSQGFAPLSKACSRRQRGVYGAIKLPAPPPEGAPDLGDEAPLSAVLGADLRQDVAFAVLAPVFKGYLQVPEIRDIASFSRLQASVLVTLLQRDSTGDLAIAALNAAIAFKRLTPQDALMVVWRATGGTHRSARRHPRFVKLEVLSGAEAMLLGYAKAAAGAGLVGKEQQGDVQAMRATPRQLFERGRAHTPSTAALGPLMGKAHAVDLEARLGACRPDKRSESLLFLVQRSALPKPAAAALSEALQAVRNRCKLSQKGAQGAAGNAPRR